MVTGAARPPAEDPGGLRSTDAPALVALCLAAIGLLAVTSAAAWGRASRLGGGDGFEHLRQHGTFAVLAIGLVTLLRRLDPSWLRRVAGPGALVSVALLAVLLVPGMPRLNQAHRWVVIGPVNFQPSELSKLLLVIYLADFLHRRARGLPAALPRALGIVGLHVLLVALEPDVGTALFLCVLSLTMLAVGGVSLRYLVGLPLLLLPVAALLLWDRAPHVIDRLQAFGDPTRSHQVWQSLLALGSGGLLGKGLGGSVQKLAYLPYPDCDFVLAIVGEELGFVGTASVLLLFGAFLVLGLRTVRLARAPFEGLLALGITFSLGLQAAINIAVVTASVPAKGIPLPFLSKGGSSLLVSAAAVGLLLSVGRVAREVRESS
jgi:cell division protein FtsW